MVVINEIAARRARAARQARLRRDQTPHLLDVELWQRSGHYENYRENMYFTRDGRGRARVRDQADELPGRLPRLRVRAPLLPRPAAAPRRVRALHAQRARGRAARAAARARVHAGRRARLLHGGADRAGGARHHRGDRRALRAVRLRGRARRAVDAAREVDRHRRAVGDRRVGADARRSRRWAASTS